MASAGLRCWKCLQELEEVLTPMPRLAKCKHCKADLHVCRLCEFYDTTVNNACREPIADKVNDKTRSNYCGYYQITTVIAPQKDSEIDANKSSLEDLFGLEQDSSELSISDADKSKQALDALFGLNSDKD